MSSAKKIGLFACTGVVAGNMMGSGIALLPANLASIGGIAIWGWVISIIGAMSLAYVYARLATKNPQQGGPIAYAGEISPAFGFQTGVLYYHANWIGNLAIGITAVSYLSTFFPILNNPVSQGSSMIKTFRFALLACGLVGGALTATAAPAVPVRVATVELAPHAEERAIPGRVEAIRAVDIRARTEGVIVQRHFQDGQYVTEGDLLFTLDDAQPRAALALAQAELKSAEASLRQSQQLLTRYERLINNHSISRNDVDTARMQRDVAAAAVQQAKARVEAQQIVLSYTQIAALVTGRVGHSAFHVGTLVNSSSGVLVDIVQLDPVRVSFALDEAAFFSKTGQHADIHALKQAWLAQIEVDGKRRDGVLTSIDNRIDARTGSVAVRAEFANPQHRLLPGGSVTILFRPQELPSRVMVPAAAVQQDPQGFFSWVLKPDHTAGQRRLTLAGQQGQQFAVEKGLQAGEQVITDGAQRLREGAAVQVLN
ncbi:efflux RND transporter periplasmic adaptor subunit [Klebsiella pneumoniae]